MQLAFTIFLGGGGPPPPHIHPSPHHPPSRTRPAVYINMPLFSMGRMRGARVLPTDGAKHTAMGRLRMGGAKGHYAGSKAAGAR
jgi:hypothetical protein